MACVEEQEPCELEKRPSTVGDLTLNAVGFPVAAEIATVCRIVRARVQQLLIRLINFSSPLPSRYYVSRLEKQVKDAYIGAPWPTEYRERWQRNHCQRPVEKKTLRRNQFCAY